jgi:hypothetical protein
MQSVGSSVGADGGGVVVTKDWVYACKQAGALVPVDKYIVPLPAKASPSSGAVAGKKHSLSSPAAPALKLHAPQSPADSDDTQDMDVAPAPAAAAAARPGLPRLPEFLRGLHVHITGPVAADRARTLRRYVVAYDGCVRPGVWRGVVLGCSRRRTAACSHVDAKPSAATTHVVVADRGPASIAAAGEAVEEASGAEVVVADWLDQCHTQQRRVDEEPFRV